MLADNAGETKVRQLAEKLIDAHTATVEWLTVVLAEEALGGPVALVATPLQRVAGGMARAVNAPVRFWANTVNNAVDTVQHAGDETTERFGAVADRASALTGAVRETLTAGRGASLRRPSRSPTARATRTPPRPPRPPARSSATSPPTSCRSRTTTTLSVSDAVKAIKNLTTPHDINVVIRYEETHKGRANVASAAQTQLAALAKEAVGVSS